MGFAPRWLSAAVTRQSASRPEGVREARAVSTCAAKLCAARDARVGSQRAREVVSARCSCASSDAERPRPGLCRWYDSSLRLASSSCRCALVCEQHCVSSVSGVCSWSGVMSVLGQDTTGRDTTGRDTGRDTVFRSGYGIHVLIISLCSVGYLP